MPDANDMVETAKAVRLIFEYEGQTVRLISQQSVDVVVPDADLSPADRPGHFVDIRDASNKMLARVMARGAFLTSAEVFPERPGDRITRVDIPVPQGAFTVVVPVIENADHVTLVKVAPGVTQRAGPAVLQPELVTTDVASFPLAGRQPTGNGGLR